MAKKISRCDKCGSLMQVYARKLRSDMAKALIYLERVYPDSMKVSELKPLVSLGAIADFHKLKHWGLIAEDRTKKTGYWKITALGIDFISGKISIPLYQFVYRDVLQPRPDDDARAFERVRFSELGYTPINKTSVLQDSIPFEG